MDEPPAGPKPSVLYQGWKRLPQGGWQKVGAPLENRLRIFEAMTNAGFAQGQDDPSTTYIVLLEGEYPQDADRRQYRTTQMRPPR